MIKKPIILIFLVSAMLLFMTSCEEEFMIDQDFESKLVINALFDDNSPWAIEVSNTTNILDLTTEIERLANAKVEIFDQNDEFKYFLFHQGNGIYGQEDFTPSPKRGYSVKVSASGYRTVTAKSFVPEKSKLLINNFTIIANEKYEDVEVDFVIEDRSQWESYYIWEIVNIDENNQGEGDDASNLLSKTWIDDLTNNPNDLLKGSREILENNVFGDGTYTGSYSSSNGNRRIGVGNIKDNALINYAYELNSSSKLDPNNNPDDLVQQNDVSEDDPVIEEETEKVVLKYELRVMSISKELYEYYTSVEEYYQNKDINHSNQVPLDIYTNVSNGLGIFAGFSESVLQF